jgi:hypothetical protein
LHLSIYVITYVSVYRLIYASMILCIYLPIYLCVWAGAARPPPLLPRVKGSWKSLNFHRFYNNSCRHINFSKGIA